MKEETSFFAEVRFFYFLDNPMNNVIIRQALPGELAEVLRIQKAAFRIESNFYQFAYNPPLTETLAGIRNARRQCTLLVAAAGRIIKGSVRGQLHGRTCHITRLSVHPSYWGQGIGKSLMGAIESAFSYARRYELFTGSLSDRNINMYLSLGYQPFKFERVSDRLTFVYLEKENL